MTQTQIRKNKYKYTLITLFAALSLYDSTRQYGAQQDIIDRLKNLKTALFLTFST